MTVHRTIGAAVSAPVAKVLPCHCKQVRQCESINNRGCFACHAAVLLLPDLSRFSVD